MADLLTLPIQTLEWASKKIGLTISDVATLVAKRANDIENIKNGKMTFAQATKFATVTKQPLGFLFLDTPVEDYKPEIPDLRTRPNRQPLSENFYNIFKDISYKQEWYKEYLLSINASDLDFVGSFDAQASALDIANSIRKTLNLSFSDSLAAATIDEYYKVVSDKAESAGILVMRNSVVKNSTRKSLNPDEFLGFAISDKFAPTIFINAADKTAAKIFTIVHELAHIWLGVTSVSDDAITNDNAIEQKCNAVAAEVLVPKAQFETEWSALPESKEIHEKLYVLRQKFKVSEMALARVALTHNKISQDTYGSIYRKQLDEIKRLEALNKLKKKSDGGPSAKYTYPIRNSKTLTNTVTGLVESGRVSLKQASLLLNISTNKIANYV
jgi:Zn-dependent peptidase ImmA (M78 family)